MDFYLRCNSLKCRSQLKERAVVTTCSHIFCLHCADKLGLSHPTTNGRRCPACQSALLNPDDAVSTILNPTEDYKTSVLSGMDPSTIMECAGRALAFWAYQTTQEVFYQEFLGKTLTEKYTSLNTQMDKVIHNANSEISTLQARVSDMQTTQDQLHKKNHDLAELYREKSKKFTQVTNLYNILKSRAMRTQMQSAASDSVSRTLDSLARNESATPMPVSMPVTGGGKPVEVSRPQTPRQNHMYPVNRDGVEQLHRYQRSGTGSSKGKRHDTVAPTATATGAMPPPSRPGNMRTSDAHRTRLTSRPSTGVSQFQLPTDQAMLSRFQDGSGTGFGGGFAGQRERTVELGTGRSGIRSVFENGSSIHR